MYLKCPGLSSGKGNLDSSLVECPGCGHEVEMFGDEFRVHCRCGKWVYSKALPSCFQWCDSAQQCLGTVDDFRPTLRKIQGAPDQERQKKRLEKLRRQIEDCLEGCADPQTRRKAVGKQTD